MSTINIVNKGWVEIKNPQSQELFYANIETGEVFLEKPQGANLIPKDSDEWWELWDDNYKLPYYHHTTTGRTEWNIPKTGNLILLTKVQNSSVGKRLTTSILSTSSGFDDRQMQTPNSSEGDALNVPSSAINGKPLKIEEDYFLRNDSSVKNSEGNENAKYREPSDAERNNPRESVTVNLSSTIHLPPAQTTGSQIYSITTTHQFITNSTESESVPTSPSKMSPQYNNKSDKYFINNGKLYVKDGRDSISFTQYSFKPMETASSSSPEDSSIAKPLSPSFNTYVSEAADSSNFQNGRVQSEHEYWNNVASLYSDEPPKTPNLNTSFPMESISSGKHSSNTVFHLTEEQPLPEYSYNFCPQDSRDWHSPADPYPHYGTSDINYGLPVDKNSWQNPINAEWREDNVVKNNENFDGGNTNYNYKEINRGVSTFSRELDTDQLYADGFARKYLNIHKKGVFRRIVPIENMLLFQKEKISQPLIASNPLIKKDAIKCFKSVQRIMGDRPMKKRHTRNDRASVSYSSRLSTSTLSTPIHKQLEEIQCLLNKGIFNIELRDEIYMQVLKQLTKNFNSYSVIRGWELLCVLAVTFLPSKNFEPYLLWFIKEQFDKETDQVDIYSKHVFSRLKRTNEKGSRGKALTLMEIKREMETPFNPSIFGESLESIMNLQERTNPGLGLMVPRALPFLAYSILELNGQTSEGIFRIPGEADQVVELKLRIDNNDYDITGITDPNVPASLLKFWLRDLSDPLIPNEFYGRCIETSGDICSLMGVIKELPEINRRVIVFVIRFLQIFSTPRVINKTKMNVNNLSMVFAPNFLRCPFDSVVTVFNNAVYEQLVVKTLLMNFKPDDMEDDGRFGFKFEDLWINCNDNKSQNWKGEQNEPMVYSVESKC